MPVCWDDQADAKLLVGILHTSKPKLDYGALAKYMGTDVTVCAIQHRIQRLKERAKGDSTGPRSPSTPKGKRGRHSKKKDDEPATKKPKTADETGGDAAAGGDAAVAQT